MWFYEFSLEFFFYLIPLLPFTFERLPIQICLSSVRRHVDVFAMSLRSRDFEQFILSQTFFIASMWNDKCGRIAGTEIIHEVKIYNGVLSTFLTFFLSLHFFWRWIVWSFNEQMFHISIVINNFGWFSIGNVF